MRGLWTAGVLAAVAAPACAQDWTYNATIYLWATDTVSTIDSRFGELESELTFSDALQQLDFAFLGAIEANNGPWSLVGDLFYFRLSESNSLDLPGYSKLSTRSDLLGVTGYGFYRVAETGNAQFDVGGGLRVFSLDQELRLTGSNPKAKVEVSETWVYPLIAARARFDFNERWFGTIGGDFGGLGGHDNQSWNAIATIGYEINDNWSVRAGYRALEVSHEINGRDFSNRQTGPIFGATYRF
jgi:opacity protein-like surface antigen